MGKPTGFMEYQRRERGYAPVADRVQHWREFTRPLPDDELRRQGARCMDCGTPYCHPACPVNNIIPDWNDLVYSDDMRRALQVLHQTNNFPDVTGRVCPAPCEAACTLNLIEQPVTIKTIEHAIIERGWSEGWVEPQIATSRSGKRIAVVGSGPAGLACAQQLARAGHDVAVFEKSPRIGGLLRYGIPDFKLEKHVIDRRIAQMRAEGVEFHPNSHIGVNLPVDRLIRDYDALVLAIGAEAPRELPVPGREL
ncbi:MAG TPA: glutamate synthase subunit beta, partial [Stellaceae bacterium]